MQEHGMSTFINTNLASINAQRNLGASQGELARSIQRLSSGLRVNSAKDDAAGLAIATRMDAQARGMNVAIRNANDGISMAQVAEGALGKIGDMLQRMRELAVQSANATNQSSDRTNLDAEFKQIQAEVTRTVDGTRFNNVSMFGAAAATGFKFQVGAGTSPTADVITVTGKDLTLAANEVEKVTATATVSIDGADATNATAAIAQIDLALDEVNGQRAMWGAAQNRFEAVIANLQSGSENMQAARSRIMDADFARETAALTRSQILQQAGTAMLAQANQVPQQVLQLLQR
jgi:flagellin